jgi:outer membrane immunogenic protein
MRTLLAAAAAAILSGLLSSGPASAADIAPQITKAPPAIAPAWSWTGFYIGGNIGYGFTTDRTVTTVGQTAINNATVADGARPTNFSLENDGFLAGGQIGYNWQFGSYVLGVEADIQYTDFRDSVNVVTTGVAFPGTRNNLFSQELEFLGTVRGRLGWTWDRTLIYATGGFAYGEVNSATNFFGPLPANVLQFAGSTRNIETGFTVGGGIEHAFAPNWSVKAEYLYYDLGDTTVATNVIPGSGGVGTGYNVTFRNDGHIARVGLNYKLGW